MQQYMIIRFFAMVMALVSAFYLFCIRVKRLYHLMMAVEGETPFKLDRIAARIWVLIKDVLAQTNVRRKKLPGLAHSLIFFGFLAIQPHSLELMIRGIYPGFELGRWIPGVYGGYLVLADILAPLVLVGFAYAIYRRLLDRPRISPANVSLTWIEKLPILTVRPWPPRGRHRFPHHRDLVACSEKQEKNFSS